MWVLSCYLYMLWNDSSNCGALSCGSFCHPLWVFLQGAFSFTLLVQRNNLKFSNVGGLIVWFPCSPVWLESSSFSCCSHQGCTEGCFKWFWQNQEMDAKRSLVLGKSALKLGCSCCMDDCAAPSLAQTCQLFGFPASSRLVCCAGRLEMWVAVVTMNWQDDSRSNPSWLRGWVGADSAVQICVVPDLRYIPCVFYDKNFSEVFQKAGLSLWCFIWRFSL